MDRRQLGRSALVVSRLWLGTASFGAWGTSDRRVCRAIVDRALDAGINTIDTADSYSKGEAEEIVADAVAGRRDDVVLATKFGYAPASASASIADAAGIVASCEASLRRLRTDRIDLYQLHRVDPRMRLEEILAGLDALVRDGKVLAVGSSMFRADQMVEALWIAAREGLAPIASEQPPYSLFVREIERSVLAAARRHHVGIVAFGALNGGWLTGKYRAGGGIPAGSRADTWPIRRERYDFEREPAKHKLEKVEALSAIAGDLGCSLSQLAIAFALAHPTVTSVIVGARDVEQLDQLLPATGVELDDDVLDRLDELAPPGTTVDPEDLLGYASPDLTDAAVRRVVPD